jgi:hypothetical protein
VQCQQKRLLVSEEPHYEAASAQESFPSEAAISIITGNSTACTPA